NRALDARSFGQPVLPAKIGNTAGGTLGGPVRLPRVYNGADRTFFYFTWESMRFPRQQTLRDTVPTDAMKLGNFDREGLTVRDPSNGLPFPQNSIPLTRINGAAIAIMPFYPSPNFGGTVKVSSGNYVDNRKSDIDSNQWDLRIDHQIRP